VLDLIFSVAPRLRGEVVWFFYGGDAENRTLISRFEAVRPDPLDHIPLVTSSFSCILIVATQPVQPRARAGTLTGRRCRTRTGIQSLEDSVLILLNEAPFIYSWCGMQESNLLRLA
jgi:hypothetical protein